MYNFQVDEFHTYHVGELGVLVHNAEKYGNGHYDNNPSDNPKVLADAEEDPNAVYGYKPKKDGSLKNFANEDWSDPELVESARQKRIQYIEDDRSICDLVSDMKNKGCSTEEIAHSICDYRNQTRLNSYLDLDGNIINENGYNAALERMQTRSYDALISSGKTPEQIISSWMRTNPAMDINYKGYNPLFTMLLGEFSADCEIDSIHFDVKSENSRQNNTLYAIVQKEVLELFIKDIYFFIIENKIEQKLNERDKSIWSF